MSAQLQKLYDFQPPLFLVIQKNPIPLSQFQLRIANLHKYTTSLCGLWMWARRGTPSSTLQWRREPKKMNIKNFHHFLFISCFLCLVTFLILTFSVFVQLLTVSFEYSAGILRFQVRPSSNSTNSSENCQLFTLKIEK